jgi:hypothetical protein
MPMHRRAALPLLATALLAAGPDLRLDLRTDLGGDPATRIRLVPPGIWNGLLASRVPARPATRHRGMPEATVEVADSLPPANPRSEAFHLYAVGLRERLLRGFQAPPPSQGKIDLAEFMAEDPARPEAANLDRARSLQERYNRLPPNGSPVALK